MNVQRNNLESLSLIRLIGYGLLVSSLIYILDIFVPPQFTNPDWEFASAALVLERAPLPLVGLVLVFWGDAEARKKWENPILGFLSWATLFAGILYLLLIPLGISAASRLNTRNLTQLSTQYERQISQLDQVQSQMEKADATQLNQLVEAFKSRSPNMANLDSDTLKTRLNEDIVQARQNADAVRQRAQRGQSLGILKNSVRMSLLSLIFAFLFLSAWRFTAWARQFKIFSRKAKKLT